MAKLCTNKIQCTGIAIKASALLVLTGLSIVLLHLYPVRTYLRPDVMEAAVRAAGLWGPSLFMFCSMVGICLFVPGTVFLGLAVALFGTLTGFLYLWTAALAASCLSFLLSRTLGRDFAVWMIGKKMVKYDDLIESNGFTAVLYLRLMCFPFAVLNYGMGLSKVRFWDYFLATALGEAVSIFVFAFFLNTLKEIWLEGTWGRLFSIKFALSLGLIVFSLAIPKIIGGVRRRRAQAVNGPLKS